MSISLIAAAATALAFHAGCDLEAPSGLEGCTRAAVDALPINALQAVGTHNSYKLAIAPKEMALLRAVSPDMARGLDYAHVPLAEQLVSGARQLELDLFADPEGGRFLAPLGQRMAPGTEPYDVSRLTQPGLKVMHVQDVDYRSSCQLFRDCLRAVADWSAANRDHVPIVILLNLKEGDALPAPGAIKPLPFDAAAMDAVDSEIRSVFGPDQLITPDQVQGAHDTLRAAVAAGAWPSLGEGRGRVMFALDAPRNQVDLYRGDRRSLEGRAAFVNIEESEDAAAYITLNAPLEQTDRIAKAVAAGLIVRTRADADTAEARTGETARREAAFASGAHYISTDYMTSDPRWTDYQVRLPGGGVARLNPKADTLPAGR